MSDKREINIELKKAAEPEIIIFVVAFFRTRKYS